MSIPQFGLIFFRGESEGKGEDLGSLIEKNRVAINPVIRLEVLTGAKNQEQFDQLSANLEGIIKIPFEDKHWQKAERLRFNLMNEGLVIPIADILVAATALTHDLELFHQDEHFHTIKNRVDLKFFNQ